MNALPKISIITPTFNAAATIAACIESVATQTYPNKEHWIIDGLSTDDTMTIVRRYAAIYPHIRYLSEKDQGIYDAMNKGILLSEGEWLYFLGADDSMYERETLQRIFQEDLTSYHFIYGHINIDNQYIVYQSAPLTPEKLLLRDVHHQACFYKKELFELLGLYDIQYKLTAERDFNIRWMAAGYKAKFFPVIIANFAVRGASAQTSNKLRHTHERSVLLIKGLQNLDLTAFQKRKIQLRIIYFLMRTAFIDGYLMIKELKELHKEDKKAYCKALKLLRSPVFLKQHISPDGAFLNLYQGSVFIGYWQILHLLNGSNFYFYLKNGAYWLLKRFVKNA